MQYLTSLLLVFTVYVVTAHNGCGTAVSGNNQGLLAGFQNSSIGVNWYFAGFSSNNWDILPVHLRGSVYDVTTEDIFHTVELSGQFYLLPNLRLHTVVPFRINHRRASDGFRQTRKGLSDVRLMAIYTLINRKDQNTNWQFYWEAGLGVRLPTGDYESDLSDNNLPDNFNLGTGGWGYMGQSTVVVKRGQLGWNLTANYQYIPKNKEEYTFGNQITWTSLVFWEKRLSEKWSIWPNAGVYYENVKQDLDQLERQILDTGGKGTYLITGADLFFRQWRLSGQWYLPVRENYAAGEMDAQNRFNLNLSYIF